MERQDLGNSELQILQKDCAQLITASKAISTEVSKNLGGARLKKVAHYQLFLASHYYFEALIGLSNSRLPYAMEPLLRVLWENSLSMDYILIDKTNASLASYRLSRYLGIYGQEKRISAWKDFKANNPKVGPNNLKDENLDEYLRNTAKQLKKEFKLYSPQKLKIEDFRRDLWPTAKLRARAIDVYESKRNAAHVNSVEWDYLSVYWLLSDPVHLGPYTVDRITEQIHSGNANKIRINVYRTISTGYAVHSLVADQISRVFKLKNKDQRMDWKAKRDNHGRVYSELEAAVSD